MKVKLTLIFLSVFVLFLLRPELVFGFGISPPRVFNDRLVPGARFEQMITLTQAEAKQAVRINVFIEAPEIESWFSIEPSKDFVIPEGSVQFPMKVVVDVPKDAGYGVYNGLLRIRIVSGSAGEGQVAVLSGSVAQVRLAVTGEEYSDFKLREIKIPTVEQGEPLKVEIKLENLGNVKVRPSRVALRIFDQYQKEVLETGELSNMNWVDSFAAGTVVGEMPTRLGIGSYWAEVEIYKKDSLYVKDKITFRIVEKGKKGIVLGLKIWQWGLILSGLGVFVLFLRFSGRILKKFGIRIKVERQ